MIASTTLRGSEILVERHRDRPLREHDQPPADRHMLKVLIDARVEVDHAWDGKCYRGPQRSGDLSLVPAGRPTRWRGKGRVKECLQISLPREVVRRVAHQEFNCDRATFDLVGDICFADTSLFQLSFALRNELIQGGPGGRLLVDSATTMMVVHLLRTHSNLAGTQIATRSIVPRGLTRKQLRRVLEYIEAHLSQDICLADLAEIVGLSQGHFRFAFRLSMGQSPYCFVTEQRMDRARQLLRDDRLTIAEVALAVGYADQSHFTTKFRAVSGTTPYRFRRALGTSVP